MISAQPSSSGSPPFQTLELPDTTTTIKYIQGHKRDYVLVFLHGLLGDSQTWEMFDPYDAPWRYADCYFMDFRFEQRRPEPTSFPLIVQETQRLLAAHVKTEGRPLTLVGNSFGGHLALFMTHRKMLESQNIVLFSPGGIAEVVGDRSQFASYRSVDKILEVSFERIFNDPAVQANPEIQDRIQKYRERLHPHRRVFARNMLEMARGVKVYLLSNEDLRQIPTPTALIWGSRDMITPPLACKVMAENIPNARVVWIDSGHAPHIECAKESSKILRDVVHGVVVGTAGKEIRTWPSNPPKPPR